MLIPACATYQWKGLCLGLNDEKFDLKVGDIYGCPEGHKAKIVWIQEEKKFVAVKCPEKHFDKFVIVYDKSEGWGKGRSSLKRKRENTLET